MGSKVVGLLAVLVVGAFAGCGGDDDDDGGGDGSGGDALTCIQDAGLTATSSPGNPSIGTTEQITVDVSPDNRIIVNRFEDEQSAEDYAEGEGAFLSGAGAGGSSEVVGTDVVGVAKIGAGEEVETVKDCL